MPARSRAAVEVRDLVKSYGSRAVVDHLSFEIERGEIFALLGPNGAGKTTTIEILEGFRRQDGGSVSVLGLNPVTQAKWLKPRVGAMLQEGGLYPAITPREALRLFASYYDQPRDGEELIQTVGLTDAASVRYRRLSGGQKQRLALALALIGNPQLVYLDEPTAGLDPQARRAAWRVIKGLQNQGVTVLLTTHYLEEAEQLADRVAIISAGRLLAIGAPTSLVRADRSVVYVRTLAPVSSDLFSQLPAALSVTGEDDTGYVVETNDALTLLTELTAALRQVDILATEIRVGDRSLEDLFLRLTASEDQ